MQPRPSAETSRSLFPSLRFCIAPPDVLVLRAANLLHPVHGLAVELFLNGDVRHGGRCPGAVPVLLTWRNPDNVTGRPLRPLWKRRAPRPRSSSSLTGATSASPTPTRRLNPSGGPIGRSPASSSAAGFRSPGRGYSASRRR